MCKKVDFCSKCKDFITINDDAGAVSQLIDAEIKDQLLDSYNEMWGAKYGGAFVTADGTNVFIKKVIYHKPKVTILWNDGTKSVASCTAGDTEHFSFESGLNIAINNRLYGYAEMNRLYDDWLPDKYSKDEVTTDDAYEITISDVRKRYKLKYAIEDKIADMYVEAGMKEYLEGKGYTVIKK